MDTWKIERGKMKLWKCSLCNIELPDDEYSEIRKRRHSSFHVDETVGTSKHPRNWTFGVNTYELIN